MGLFNNKNQDDIKGKKIYTVVNAEYLGGYQKYRKGLGNLTFFEQQIKFSAPLGSKLSITRDETARIVVEGSDVVSKRVTATRLLTLGIFAFAFKKDDRESFLTIELKDNSEIIFKIKGKSPIELKATLSDALSLYNSLSNNPREKSDNSVADELAKLADLTKKGVITQEEFNKEKIKLLGD